MVIGVMRLGLEWPVRVLVSGGVIRSFLRALRLSVFCMFFFSIFFLYKVYNSQQNCLKLRLFFVFYLFFFIQFIFSIIVFFIIFLCIEYYIKQNYRKQN